MLSGKLLLSSSSSSSSDSSFGSLQVGGISDRIRVALSPFCARMFMLVE